MPETQALVLDLQSLLDDPQQSAPRRSLLAARLQAADGLNPLLDRGLAQLWTRARPAARTLGLRPVLEGLAVGPLLRHALLETVDADPPSANAALDLLAETAPATWQPADWQRIAKVARSERSKAVPDTEAALLLARLGPQQALATVALTAFRPGPEDAADRLAAIAHLGRFGGARVAGWIRALLATGVATIECLQAVVFAQEDSEHADAWTACLEAAAGLGSEGSGMAQSDALARWTALDGLSHLAPSRALPLLDAAIEAGGADLPPWFLPYCHGRRADLQVAIPDAILLPVKLPPLGGLRSQVLARCPRIARRAAVLWREQQGDEAPLLQRAAIEKALVDRGQLLASFLATPDTSPAELGPQWAPNWLALGDAERDALLAEESAWLDG